MKLKQQFSLFTSLLVIIVITSISVAFVVYQRQFLIQEMNERREKIFTSYAMLIEEALIMDDELLLLNYIKSIKTINPEIIYMFFNNIEQDYVLGEKMDYIPERVEIMEQKGFFTYSSPRGEKIAEIASTIDIGGDLTGIARIGFSQDMFFREINAALQTAIQIVSVIALIAIILSILAATGLAGAMTRPIIKLTTGAKKVGEGDLTQHINVKAKNEFVVLAEEFNEMAVKLRKLDEMKDYFISSVSHELKSPLSYIKGYIELFLKENPDMLSDEHREYFNIIQNNISRLSGFIGDILELAKIKSGSMEINRKNGDITAVARDAVSFCRPAAAEKNINLSVESPENICILNFDIDKTNQVLQNLIGNALKFTPEGGSVTVKIIDAVNNIRVSVQDTGVGIPENKLDSVFQKFRQVKDSQDKIKNVKGTGLGLAIVKGIIDAHGEKIWVESEIDKGSSFTFTLSKQKHTDEKSINN